MCGIGGYVGPESERYRKNLADQLTTALYHRGPDANGVFLADGVVLAHTRLSILDLSVQGAQPMRSPDGRYALSYNGEIYNFLQLQQELIQCGRTFVSSSDTEVVLQALQEWGVSALERFNGMFALALWDTHEQTLLIARDRFGIKPLFYVQSDQGFAFASEVHALVSAGVVDAKLNLNGLHEYLFFGNSLGEQTLFQGCRKLPAGSYLTLNMAKSPSISVKEYWNVDRVIPTEPTESEAIERIQHLLHESVKRHLISDVPVGLFLSGGLDSSTLCAYASRLTVNPLATYSVDFEGMTAHSELELAREVSQRFNTQHNEISIGWRNLESVLEELTVAHGQPFGDAGNMPLFLLTKQLPPDTKVVLQGDGGDELFGGYRRHRLLRHAKICQWIAKLPFTNPDSPLRGTSLKRAQRMISALGAGTAAERCALLLTEEPSAASVTALLSGHVRDALAITFPIERFETVVNGLPEQVLGDAQQTMLHTDMQIVLADYFFEKVDRSTMANSVEVRVPFLDNDLCDYVMGLPAGMKIKGNSKHLLRKAMRGVLPDSVISGRKYGFGVPYVEWLRGPLVPYVEARLFGNNATMNALFDRAALQDLWREFQARRNNRGFMIYKLLMLSIWIDRYSVTL